ncbi:MAG: hypothetical protein R3E83_19295 [Burkholderiaceae bacterium]
MNEQRHHFDVRATIANQRASDAANRNRSDAYAGDCTVQTSAGAACGMPACSTVPLHDQGGMIEVRCCAEHADGVRWALAAMHFAQARIDQIEARAARERAEIERTVAESAEVARANGEAAAALREAMAAPAAEATTAPGRTPIVAVCTPRGQRVRIRYFGQLPEAARAAQVGDTVIVDHVSDSPGALADFCTAMQEIAQGERPLPAPGRYQEGMVLALTPQIAVDSGHASRLASRSPDVGGIGDAA